MSPRTWSLALGSVAALAANGYARRYAHVWASSNRIYLPVRKEMEFDPLLSLPNPLLAHFTIPLDANCQAVSQTLRTIIDGETPCALSCADVECDEPDAQPIILRYAIRKFPTILWLKGGNVVSEITPTSDDPESEIRRWIQETSNK